MKDVEVIQVVRTTLLRRGRGMTDDDPVRRITQFWTLEGELLAEVDPCRPSTVDAVRGAVFG